MAATSQAKKPAAKAKETKKPQTTAATGKKRPALEKPYSTSKLVAEIAAGTATHQAQVKMMLFKLQDLIAEHIASEQPLSLMGLLKIQVVTKPATKARKGINPLTKEPMTFKAQPARKAIKIKPLKRLKEML